MRSPLLDHTSRVQRDQQVFVPAPVRGINRRDNPLELRAEEALDLVNWIASPERVRVRPGYGEHSLTVQALSSLMGYTDGSNIHLFAAGTSNVYNVTTSLPVVVFSCTDGDFTSFNFAAGGANYLYALNGLDAPQLFNGTTWQAVTTTSTPIAITGEGPDGLTAGVPYNERIFFLKRGRQSIYYLPAGQVGGTLTEFPVGRYLARGGSLLALGVVSFDGGDGVNSNLVAASTEGEILMYRGTDPSDPAAWRLIGSYFLSPPLNKHAFFSYGSSLLYLCEGGVYDLVASLANAKTGKTLALTDRLGRLLENFLSTYKEDPKWRLSYHPQERLLVLNTPDPDGQQFVMDVRNGAWSRLTGWKASDILFFEGKFYFTSALGVYRAFTTRQDLGLPITADAVSAPRMLASPGRLTKVTGTQAWFQHRGDFQFGTKVLGDLEIASMAAYLSNAAFSTAFTWDVSLWDQATWDSSAGASHQWETPTSSPSQRVALGLRVVNNQAEISWLGSDVAFLAGRSW